MSELYLSELEQPPATPPVSQVEGDTHRLEVPEAPPSLRASESEHLQQTEEVITQVETAVLTPETQLTETVVGHDVPSHSQIEPLIMQRLAAAYKNVEHTLEGEEAIEEFAASVLHDRLAA